MTMVRVLNIVTNGEARFFQQQVDALERQGVSTTTLAVPGRQKTSGGKVSSRSSLDYLKIYPAVLRHSFGPFDLIHANYGLTAPMALAQPNLPVVVSLWGSDLMGRFGPLSRWCARHAGAVIVMSEEMGRMLGTDYYVVPHGVDLELFQPISREAARVEVGWRHEAKHVLFPYHPERDVKDFPRAERVVAAVRRRVDGDIELQTLHGVSHDQMPNYLNAADALLLTSKREGSPNTVKEAMACNVPVVATDVGDVRQRLDGVKGSYVCQTDEELTDALAAVLEHGEDSNGRSAIRELTVEGMGTDIKRIYETVLE